MTDSCKNPIGTEKIRQQDHVGGSTFYDFENVLQETDGNLFTAKEYTSTAEQYGELVSSYEAGQSLYFECDALGSTDALLTDNEFAQDRYTYRAFGLATHTGTPACGTFLLHGPLPAPLGSVGSSTSSGSEYNWVGRQGYFQDVETGLYFVRENYYDFTTGRWVGEDKGGYNVSTNLYQYCRNNPVNVTDPSGLECPCEKDDRRFIPKDYSDVAKRLFSGEKQGEEPLGLSWLDNLLGRPCWRYDPWADGGCRRPGAPTQLDNIVNSLFNKPAERSYTQFATPRADLYAELKRQQEVASGRSNESGPSGVPEIHAQWVKPSIRDWYVEKLEMELNELEQKKLECLTPQEKERLLKIGKAIIDQFNRAGNLEESRFAIIEQWYLTFLSYAWSFHLDCTKKSRRGGSNRPGSSNKETNTVHLEHGTTVAIPLNPPITGAAPHPGIILVLPVLAIDYLARMHVAAQEEGAAIAAFAAVIDIINKCKDKRDKDLVLCSNLYESCLITVRDLDPVIIGKPLPDWFCLWMYNACQLKILAAYNRCIEAVEEFLPGGE